MTRDGLWAARASGEGETAGFCEGVAGERRSLLLSRSRALFPGSPPQSTLREFFFFFAIRYLGAVVREPPRKKKQHESAPRGTKSNPNTGLNI